jgi:flagellar biosynthesis/type III secretory pathway protein FliH
MTKSGEDDDTDDEFFGDDDDGLSERESRAQEEKFRNMGFLEALEDSKEEQLQQGFEDGYQQTFDLSVEVGELLAEAALQGDTDIVKRIKTFLEKMERSDRKPSVTREELQQLRSEVMDMRKR